MSKSNITDVEVSAFSECFLFIFYYHFQNKTDGTLSRTNSASAAHNEDIMQTLLVHEPKAGKSTRIPGHNDSSDSSDNEMTAVAGIGGCQVRK